MQSTTEAADPAAGFAPLGGRSMRHWFWLAGAAAGLIAALVAWLVFRGAGLTPIAESQASLMWLDGRWTAADGVTIVFSSPRVVVDNPGGDFDFADLSNSHSWASESHLDGTGEWWFGHLADSEDATLALNFGWRNNTGSPGSVSVSLRLEGNPASPALVCQTPIPQDPCVLYKQ